MASEPEFASSFLYEELPPSSSGDRLSSSFSSDAAWDCPGCPPPYFDLPPPPRPPFLEDDDGACAANASPYEVCEAPLIIDSSAHLENDLLNVIVVVASAVVLVGVILVVACVIWR